jgi:hypothetical protein
MSEKSLFESKQGKKAFPFFHAFVSILGIVQFPTHWVLRSGGTGVK